MMKNPTLGFIGLGKMGFAMARNLLARGHRVQGYDANPQMISRLEGIPGFTGVGTAADAADGADILILMLPNGKIVRAVLLEPGPDGRIAADVLANGSIVIDMSSSSPVDTRELSPEIATRGATLVDAPVSGGVQRAETGKLAIIAGGDEKALDIARPILAAIGSSIIHVGPLGSGHAMKALNNYVSATGLVAACEAVRIAQQFGIDGQKAVDVLNASTGRNNATENKLTQFILSGTYASGFSLALMQKDLSIALELAQNLGVPTAIAEQVVDLWTRAAKKLPPSADHTEILRVLD